MRLSRNPIIFCLATIILIVACSQNNDYKADSKDDEHAHPADTENATVETPQAIETGEALPVINREHYHTVEIKQMKFIPDELAVRKGDTVVWVNNGITLHDVTEQPSSAWSSKPIPVGSSWTTIVEETAEYYCSLHVVMKGSIVVQD